MCWTLLNLQNNFDKHSMLHVVHGSISHYGNGTSKHTNPRSGADFQMLLGVLGVQFEGKVTGDPVQCCHMLRTSWFTFTCTLLSAAPNAVNCGWLVVGKYGVVVTPSAILFGVPQIRRVRTLLIDQRPMTTQSQRCELSNCVPKATPIDVIRLTLA
jgi:hypothetical protein